MRLSHEEFIGIMGELGVKITKIGRKYVYVIKASEIVHTEYLSNKHSTDLIPKDLSYTFPYGGYVTLSTAVLRDHKIDAIKLVRQHTNLGLKDAKDVCDINWNDWLQYYTNSTKTGKKQ